MKQFKLCGLGNPIVDIFLELSDPEFATLGFERGTMRLVDLEEQRALLQRYQQHEPKLVSGGSVAILSTGSFLNVTIVPSSAIGITSSIDSTR